MLIILLALIDIHTLFVLLFHNYLSTLYVFAGSSFIIAKGTLFYLSSRDVFSMIDILIGLAMLFLMVGDLFSTLSWMIGIYLVYKIILSFLGI